jgi:hypothetical protein
VDNVQGTALTLCRLARVQDGCTPLHDAASGGHDTVVEVLVRASANVNAVDKVRYFTIFASPRCNATVDNMCRERHSRYDTYVQATALTICRLALVVAVR